MKTGKNGIALIKKFEGCGLVGYLCPANIPTIGYGYTGLVHDKKIVPKVTKITQAEAEAFLKNDLIRFEKGISGLLKVPVNQNQFDALVSFAYNLGIGALADSTLLQKVNRKDFSGASKEFMKWVYANHKILQGLVKRRSAESILFSTGQLII